LACSAGILPAFASLCALKRRLVRDETTVRTVIQKRLTESCILLAMITQEQRGLRFRFSAPAEVSLESTPNERWKGQVAELSLRGCFLETTASFEQGQRLLVRVFHAGQYFEALGSVLYTRPIGVGLVFVDVKPSQRAALQKWILAALQAEIGPE
jgi:PilZ domain